MTIEEKEKLKDYLIIALRNKGMMYSFIHEIVNNLMSALSVDRRHLGEVTNDLKDVADAIDITVKTINRINELEQASIED